MTVFFQFFKNAISSQDAIRHGAVYRKAVSLGFLTLKGGVGKTSLCVSTARVLADEGRKVLVIDCDPQANATFCLSGKAFEDIERQWTLYDILTDRCDARQALQKSAGESGIDLISANSGGALLNQSRDSQLLQRFQKLVRELRGQYDFIIFDTGPSSSVLHGMIVSVCDFIFSPVRAESLSLQGLARTILDIDDIRRKLHSRTLHRVILNLASDEDESFFHHLQETLAPATLLPRISKWHGFEPSAEISDLPCAPQMRNQLEPLLLLLREKRNLTTAMEAALEI
jgi:cellulose biosynthesis protein BcsQ